MSRMVVPMVWSKGCLFFKCVTLSNCCGNLFSHRLNSVPTDVLFHVSCTIFFTLLPLISTIKAWDSQGRIRSTNWVIPIYAGKSIFESLRDWKFGCFWLLQFIPNLANQDFFPQPEYQRLKCYFSMQKEKSPLNYSPGVFVVCLKNIKRLLNAKAYSFCWAWNICENVHQVIQLWRISSSTWLFLGMTIEWLGWFISQACSCWYSQKF